MITRILVALDGSARAVGVLGAAAELAERFDARLFLLRAVMIPPEYPAAAAAAAPDDPLPEIMRRHAMAELAALSRDIRRARQAAPIVEIGEPSRTILTTAARLDVDLIVLGSHGFGGIDHLIGTTAARVANRADRNVLVVHEHRRIGA